MKEKVNQFLMACLLASMLLGLSGAGLAIASPAGKNPAEESAGGVIFLPVTMRGFPAQTIFGVEHWGTLPGTGFEKAVQAGSTWVRLNGLLWSDVEPSPGQFVWPNYLEKSLQEAYQKNQKVILIVRSSPTWARRYPDSACGPIRMDENVNGFAAFAEFMRAVVARYSVPPYNVQYYEIGNEPDAPIVFNADASVTYGCWGDENDRSGFYGGGYYGEMLKTVYPVIKSVNPQAQVLFGGLLLDCNPNKCPNSSRPPAFFEGALAVGAGNAFDGVSFHAYDHYEQGSLGNYANGNWTSTWSTAGPVVTQKAAFLQARLDQFGLTGKYLINTEGALVTSDGAPCDAACEQSKAFYVTELYAETHRLGLPATIWYSLLGWRNSGLITSSFQPLPAYNAFVFARQKMGVITSVNRTDLVGSLRSYEFGVPGGKLQVLWSLSGQIQNVTMAKTPSAVYVWDAAASKYVSAAAAQQISVGRAPVYVEFK